MIKRILFLVIVTVLFAISFIAGAQVPSVIFSGDTGVKLEVAAPTNIPISTYVNVTVHIFNASDGKLLDANDFTCSGLLLNQTGMIISKQTAGVIDEYSFFTLSNTMATTPGIYPYTFHCNSSTQGGFYSSHFEVTVSGNESIGDNFLIFLYILFMIVTIILLFSLIINIAKLATLSTTVMDVAYSWSIYLGVVIVWWVSSLYLPLTSMTNILGIYMTYSGFTHIILPVIALIIVMFAKAADKRKPLSVEEFTERLNYG